jgi:hypothetical protein
MANGCGAYSQLEKRGNFLICVISQTSEEATIAACFLSLIAQISYRRFGRFIFPPQTTTNMVGVDISNNSIVEKTTFSSGFKDAWPSPRTGNGLSNNLGVLRNAC